jgi:hypothetical protein
MVPRKYPETGIHFLSQTELHALQQDPANADAHAYAYVVCLDLVREGRAATAGRSPDGLFTFINEESGCLAVVEHPKYGEGWVTDIIGKPGPSGQLLTIAFPGVKPKRFDTRWAPITWRTTPDPKPRRHTSTAKNGQRLGVKPNR